MIRIVNLKIYTPNDDEVLFKVDRTSPIGNPFVMRDETQRDQVCEEYAEYFANKVKINHPNFMNYLDEIYESSLINNIALGCWCSPARCHGETVKKYLEERND